MAEHEVRQFRITNVIRRPDDLGPAECCLEWEGFTTTTPPDAVIQTASDLYGCAHTANALQLMITELGIPAVKAVAAVRRLVPEPDETVTRLFHVAIALATKTGKTWVTIESPSGDHSEIEPQNALDMAQGLMAIAISTETDNLVATALRDVLKVPEHQITVMFDFLMDVRQTRDPGFERFHETENARTMEEGD